MMPDDEDDEENGPREIERGSMAHSFERLREVYAGSDDVNEDGNVEFAGGITLNVEDAGNYVLVEPEDDGDIPLYEGYGESNGSHEEGFNPEEENLEAEDMPGDNADEREEAYDNHDWDAADG
jgi:hypothetical protein